MFVHLMHTEHKTEDSFNVAHAHVPESVKYINIVTVLVHDNIRMFARHQTIDDVNTTTPPTL